jgi:hypothetical protein
MYITPSMPSGANKSSKRFDDIDDSNADIANGYRGYQHTHDPCYQVGARLTYQTITNLPDLNSA